MRISAKDKATGKDQHIVIQPSGGSSKSEIDEMVKKAEAMRERNVKKKGCYVKTYLDTHVHNTEKTLNEYRAKLSQDDITAIESAITEAKEVITGNDLEKMNQAKVNLDTDSTRIGQAM